MTESESSCGEPWRDRARYGAKLLPQVEELIALDEKHRAALKLVEDLRAVRNASSQAIGKAKAQKDEDGAQKLMAEVATLKDKMAALEAELEPIAKKTKDLALSLPNLPHDSVPDGKDETANVEIRKNGVPRTFEFDAKDHQTVGETLGIIDMAAGAKLAGARFSLWRGQGARLMRGASASRRQGLRPSSRPSSCQH